MVFGCFFGPWQGRCVCCCTECGLSVDSMGFLVYLRIYPPSPNSDHMALIQRVEGEQDIEKPSGLQQDIRPQEPTLKKKRSQQKISQSMPNPPKKKGSRKD